MKHKLLEVINIGQGDCLILRPENCLYSEQAFIIDTGRGTIDYTKCLGVDEEYNVLLTHSHNDHVEGFKLLLGSRIDNMKSLILPYYHNECVLIVQALINLKGMASLSSNSGLRWQLEQVIANQYMLINLNKKIEIKFVGVGDKLCDHMEVLNPPLIWEDNFKRYEDWNNDVKKILELFEDRFSDSLKTYFNMARNNKNGIDADVPFINELKLKGNNKNTLSNQANFILGFLHENMELMSDFNKSPTHSKLNVILKQKVLKEHQACVVMKCIYNDKKFLFGGDADISVWNRLISEGKDISADYLKVPHHGSKNNINKKILKKISPQIAIISHDNRLFGRAKDPHPNNEVLNWLKSEKIDLISTNNIRKQGKEIWNCKNDNKQDNHVKVVNV